LVVVSLVDVLADEQAALRRVATLVARGAAPEEVFAAVAGEVGRLLSVEYAGLFRAERDGTVTIVAGAGRRGDDIPVGRRWPLGGKNTGTLVFETGRPARIDSYADASGALSAAAHQYALGSGVGTPIIVDGKLWGGMAAYSGLDQPLPADTEARLASFTELVATAVANAESRAALARLAEEQAALRRVATLVARGAAPEEVFAAVAEEVGRLLPVDVVNMGRYEPGRTLTFLASWDRAGQRFPVGRRRTLGGHNLGTIVFETGRPGRIDGYGHRSSGPLGAATVEAGIRSAVGTPILAEGRLWGVISAGSSREQLLPPDAEARLVSFTELVATAIANAESRVALARLAEEQAALRRVATLVARAAAPEEVFTAVTQEVGRLLGMHLAGMGRYDNDNSVTVLATWAAEGEQHPLVPGPWPLEGDDLASMVWRTGGPVRIDDYDGVPGPIAAFVRDELGICSSVASPILVEGRLWGVLFVHSKWSHQPSARDTESRLTDFTELVAAAIANTEGRAELLASRARIVAAADEMRRRIERDLHDGTQQQLVSLMLELRLAEAAEPADVGQLRTQAAQTAQGLGGVLKELQAISRGIHPAVLSKGGLEPAVRALARRSALPVTLDLRAGRRLPEPVEVAAYYVVSEALANAAKHAHASAVDVQLDADDGTMRLAIRDDGIGGADPARGSGLIGLSDRIQALAGTLEITSPAGRGTTLLIEIPA
jgi:signal transduction histidine kinase